MTYCRLKFWSLLCYWCEKIQVIRMIWLTYCVSVTTHCWWNTIRYMGYKTFLNKKLVSYLESTGKCLSCWINVKIFYLYWWIIQINFYTSFLNSVIMFHLDITGNWITFESDIRFHYIVHFLLRFPYGVKFSMLILSDCLIIISTILNGYQRLESLKLPYYWFAIKDSFLSNTVELWFEKSFT